jgi:hypothetical protein
MLTYKKVRHACFSWIRHFEAKLPSNNYIYYSVSLVKISARTVEVLLSNSVKIVWDQYKIIVLLLLLFSVFTISQERKISIWDFDWFWKLEDRATKWDHFRFDQRWTLLKRPSWLLFNCQKNWIIWSLLFSILTISII